MRRSCLSLPALLLIATAGLSGCGGDDFSEADKATIASLSLAALPPAPADPSNRYAEDAAAAAFGATLFFEQRMSRDGNVSCATCHLVDRQFQDDLPRAKAVGTTNRRTMPLAGAAWSPWQFWDGRRDSLWAQALTPLEDPMEHAGTRAGYAHVVADNFADRYARIFGPLPDLSAVPARAGPRGTPDEVAAWEAMDTRQRQEIDRVFANLGKALGAFVRSIEPVETRFDRFAAALSARKRPEGDAVLTPDEIAGLKLFLGKGDCATCHNGPRFTDDGFHNTGIPVVPGLPEDLGRQTGVLQAAADPFNCMGAFSDAGADDCGELRFRVAEGPQLLRAYKTPSLRGAATRPPYMHSGQFATLEEVVDHYARAPAAPSGETELHPITLSERERLQLIAFLGTLSE